MTWVPSDENGIKEDSEQTGIKESDDYTTPTISFGNKGFDEMDTSTKVDAGEPTDGHAPCRARINEKMLECEGLKSQNRKLHEQINENIKTLNTLKSDTNNWKVQATEATERANLYFSELSTLKTAVKGMSFKDANSTLKDEYFKVFMNLRIFNIAMQSGVLEKIMSGKETRPLILTVKNDTKAVTNIE